MTNPQITEILNTASFLGNFENNSSEWHELRNTKGVISGSEIGAILGLSPFTSAITLWAEKTGRIERDFVGNTAMRLGQLVEPAIRQLYVEQHPDHVVEEVGTYASIHASWMHANPDGVCVDETGQGYILEIKHTATYWDDVPEHYKAQVFWYMFVFGLNKAVFAVVNAGRYKEYEVLWDDFEWSVIQQQVEKFRQHVLDNLQPNWDGSESTFETVRKLSPDVEIRDEELGTLGIELINAQTDFDKAEEHLREMKSRTIGALNGAKFGSVDGLVVVQLSQRAGGIPYLTIKKNGKK
jgi:putative phage-type endonuclease